MPDYLAPAVIAKSSGLILETFFRHYLDPTKTKEEKDARETARVELLYDEAFNIMKTFLNTASHHTANALQKFGMTRTPAPPWVAVHRLHVPLSSLSSAADHLIEAFGGEDMAYKVAGGIKWWQVRTGPGVEAEWICMKKEYRQYVREEKQWSKEVRQDTEDGGFLPEMDTMRCMLYIHGGAYYWGSINTHRYAIWRFARKMRGRCFAVNYRKAPQYPFPCAVQDCLAAYLYLVHPPPGAPHHPVDPKNIIIAGDSAGGGLVWSLLQILRDTPGLELPAGAVLISPWSDLTHSFPSILQNTKTDVIPPYSFIHKPSSLWPPPPPALTEKMQDDISAKVKVAVSRGHRKGDSISVAKREQLADVPLQRKSSRTSIHTSDPAAAGKLKEFFKKKQEQGEQPANPACANPAAAFATLGDSRASAADRAASTLAQCTDPLRMEVLGERLAIDNQIQLYATNAQLCHPYVSPVLGYLGGLPPLYILAGDKEVLRDEIIYAAHKAAHPDKYPLRNDVKQLLPSLQGIERKHGPTNVHLQVYDGVGHDLPLFSMTTPARGAFRAIASFCRYVTPSGPGQSGDSTVASRRTSLTPGTMTPLSGSLTPLTTYLTLGSNGNVPLTQSPLTSLPPSRRDTQSEIIPPTCEVIETLTTPEATGTVASQPQIIETAPEKPAPVEPAPEETVPATLSEAIISERLADVKVHDTPTTPSSNTPTSSKRNSTLGSIFGHHKKKSVTAPSTPGRLPLKLQPRQEPSGDDAGPRFDTAPESKAQPGTAGYPTIYSGPEPFINHMIRERVDLNGVLRPLEPEDKLGALTMPFEQIGMIKEGPALRFVEGQALWDHRYRRVRARIERHRIKNLKMSKEHDAQRIIAKWEHAMLKPHGHHHRHRSGAHASGNVTPSSMAAGSAAPSASATASATTSASASAFSSATATAPATSENTDVDVSSSDSDSASEHGVGDSVFGPTWAWQWALHDEAPPPSAIVSRRDLPEGRNLALLADSVDGTGASRVSTLSMWVLFATFFSGSHERHKAKDALREAQHLRDEQKRQDRAARKNEREMSKDHAAAKRQTAASCDGSAQAAGSPAGDSGELAAPGGSRTTKKTLGNRFSGLFK